MAIDLVTELHKLSRDEKLKLANELLEEVYGEFDNSPAGEAAEELMAARLNEFQAGKTTAISFDEFRKKRAGSKD